MNVYLYELDSVRNSREEILIGQHKLFQNIALYGNCVVLSLNQLADSAAFWAGIMDDHTFEVMKDFCEKGLIRISLYNDKRTAAQYIVNHVENCINKLSQQDENASVFYFSLIPLTPNDKEILTDMESAILYSDVQLLKEKMTEASRTDDNKEEDSSKNKNKKNIYKFLYRYVEIILLLSRLDTVNVPQRAGAENGIELKKMNDYILEILNLYDDPEIMSGEGMIDPAVLNYMRELEEKEFNHNSRSEWYRVLEPSQSANPDTYEQICCKAETIVDFCYNCSVEESISRIDKKYYDRDSFLQMFRKESEAYEQRGHAFHFMETETNNRMAILSDENHLRKEMPNWKLAYNLVDRNIKYARRHKEYASPDAVGRNYEEKLRNQRKKWISLSRRSMFFEAVIFILQLLAFTYLNYELNELQGKMDYIYSLKFIRTLSSTGFIMVNILAVLIFALITSIIFSVLKLPDILDILKNMAFRFKEFIIIKNYQKKYMERS